MIKFMSGYLFLKPAYIGLEPREYLLLQLLFSRPDGPVTFSSPGLKSLGFWRKGDIVGSSALAEVVRQIEMKAPGLVTRTTPIESAWYVKAQDTRRWRLLDGQTFTQEVLESLAQRGVLK